MPMRSHTATNTSIGVLPAPAPRPAAAASMRLAPHSTAASELAMPIARLWWPWKPSSVSGFRASRTALQAGLHVVGQHVAGRVGDVDAVGAVAFHQPGLLDQPFGAVHVRHHQEADGVQPSLRAATMCCSRHVGLGAMRGHADGVHAQFVRHLQVVDRADAGQQQGRDLALLQQRDHGAEILLIAVRRKAVVHRCCHPGRRRA